jgi:hypothetical protein
MQILNLIISFIIIFILMIFGEQMSTNKLIIWGLIFLMNLMMGLLGQLEETIKEYLGVIK